MPLAAVNITRAYMHVMDDNGWRHINWMMVYELPGLLDELGN